MTYCSGMLIFLYFCVCTIGYCFVVTMRLIHNSLHWKQSISVDKNLGLNTFWCSNFLLSPFHFLCCFSLAAFQVLSLSFDTLIVMCHAWCGSFEFLSFGSLGFVDLDICFPLHFRGVLVISSSNKSSAHFSLSALSGTLMMWVIIRLILCYNFLKLPSGFFFHSDALIGLVPLPLYKLTCPFFSIIQSVIKPLLYFHVVIS